MRHSDIHQSRMLGVGLIMVGGALFAIAAVCAAAAFDHMAAVAALCGPGVSHCILCIASTGSLTASAGIVAAGLLLLPARPSPRRVRSRPNRPD